MDVLLNQEVILVLGVSAAIMQYVGYHLYIKYMVHGDIDPNPTTWLMFAYGTGLLTILAFDELDFEANFISFALLALPIICSLRAIEVYFRIWINNKKLGYPKNVWWPEDPTDQLSLVSDILITVIYIFIWAILSFDIIAFAAKETWAWWLLFFSNVSTFPGFIPMLREVWNKPETEDYRPWFVWGLAYCLLILATYGNTQWGIALLFYPLSNAALHILVGILALRKPKTEKAVIHQV